MTPSNHLMKERKLSQEAQEALKKAYKSLQGVIEDPQEVVKSGREAVEYVRALEGSIQLLWGFPFDPSFWYYEFMIEGCTCPFTDNYDRRKTSERIYRRDCPFHGENSSKEFKQ